MWCWGSSLDWCKKSQTVCSEFNVCHSLHGQGRMCRPRKFTFCILLLLEKSSVLKFSVGSQSTMHRGYFWICSQELLLVVLGGIIWDAGNWAQVDHVQSKPPTLFTVTLASNFGSFKGLGSLHIQGFHSWYHKPTTSPAPLGVVHPATSWK